MCGKVCRSRRPDVEIFRADSTDLQIWRSSPNLNSQRRMVRIPKKKHQGSIASPHRRFHCGPRTTMKRRRVGKTLVKNWKFPTRTMRKRVAAGTYTLAILLVETGSRVTRGARRLIEHGGVSQRRKSPQRQMRTSRYNRDGVLLRWQAKILRIFAN